MMKPTGRQATRYREAFFLVFFVLVCSGIGCNRSPDELASSVISTPDSPEVRIAFNIPITGPFGIYGQTIRDGALLAQQMRGSEAIPRVELSFQDNTGSPTDATTQLQRQLAADPHIYISGVKPQTMAIFDQVNSTSIPHFVWVFDAFITESSSSVFRTWVNYKYEPAKYLEYVLDNEVKKVSIACVNVPHTIEEFEELVIPRLNDHGVEAAIEIYGIDTQDYLTLAQKLSVTGPDLFILNGFQENLVGLVRALRAYGLVEDGNVIGTYDLLDAAIELSPEELEGIRVVTPAFTMHETQERERWSEMFVANYDREPLYTDAFSFDMMQIIYDSVERVDDWADTAKLRQAIQETSLDGVTGTLEFDESGDLLLDLRIAVYRSGLLVLDERSTADD